MTKLNSEIRELTIDELVAVSGGDATSDAILVGIAAATVALGPTAPLGILCLGTFVAVAGAGAIVTNKPKN